MSEAKKPGKSVTDVAKPGKSAPSTTSKPVIVTNRPILKDPMVVDDQAEAPDKTAGKTMAHSKIEPLGAPPLGADEAPAAKKTAINVSVTEEAGDKVAVDKAKAPPTAEKSSVTKAAPEVVPEEAKPAEAEPAEATEPQPEKPADDKPAKAPAADEAKPKAEAQPATEEGEEEAQSDTPSPSSEAIEAEAAKQAQHDTAIQKLVESKKYYLPINAVEKRRTKRFIALGIVLSLVLVVAWADIALDAGLVQLQGIKPLTHFFSN